MTDKEMEELKKKTEEAAANYKPLAQRMQEQSGLKYVEDKKDYVPHLDSSEEPSDEELAEMFGMTLEEYHETEEWIKGLGKKRRNE